MLQQSHYGYISYLLALRLTVLSNTDYWAIHLFREGIKKETQDKSHVSEITLSDPIILN